MRSLNVLFVDSDLGIRDRIQQGLGDGFVVRSVATITDAQQYLEKRLPDVIVCEVLLDYESGLDFCRFIRSAPHLKHLPFILLTSLSSIQDKVAGFSAGADDYLVKPLDTRQLVARIRLLSRIKRIEQSNNQ